MSEPRTHCPNCGAKLPEKPLSLCAYCAMPIGIDTSAKKQTGADSPNARRIDRVEANDAYAAALAWTPPETLQYRDGALRAYRSKLLLVASAGLFVVALAIESFQFGTPLWTNPLCWLAIILAGFSITRLFKSKAQQQRAVEAPLLKRSALITDRRSETTIHGWKGETTYYFQIEFADGIEGEFAYPGHGSNEEPYVTNLPGVAYTRAETLLAFKHIRV
jgi:hypothetical protein